MAGRNWGKRIGMTLGAAVVLGGLVFVALRSGPMAPIRVMAQEVRVAPIVESVFGIGTVEARRAYAVGPTVPGRVLRVNVDVGDAVHAGQVLAEMDPVDLEARLASAQAAMARADHAVDAAAAQVRDVEARVRLTGRNLARYEQLLGQRLVSPSDAEGRKQDSDAAKAGLQAAQASLAAARSDQARSRADHEALQKQRANLLLVAPVDGVITARDAESGTTLVAGQSVLRLVDPASLWVRTRIDQARGGTVAEGQAASIVLRGRPGEPHAGEVARVEWLADSVTEERLAHVRFHTLPERISIGELAEVTLRLGAAEQALVIPNAALKNEGGRLGVWRLDGEGRVAYQPVETGLRALDGAVQVTAGLARGDLVVTHSERELRPDDAVRIADALTGR